IFLSQAVIIGIVGDILGVLLGYFISMSVNQVPFEIAGLKTLPIQFSVEDFILAIAFGVITTLLAGYFPASKASKIDPVNIIRG
ncbi:MAG: FtsX-like permease family protein, partial [Paludibacter sp.]